MAQDFHWDDDFERIRVRLAKEVVGSIVNADQIVRGLKAKGFVPTGSSGLNVWVGFRFDSAELSEAGER